MKNTNDVQGTYKLDTIFEILSRTDENGPGRNNGDKIVLFIEEHVVPFDLYD